jgi:gliding motility-associated-like protein
VLKSYKQYYNTVLHLKLIFIVLFFFAQSNLLAQTYFANGDATYIGGDCYQLTPEANNKGGTVWYADKLDLTKNFDLEFYMNFGRLDGSGADGIVFVLQRASNTSLGSSGGGIGYQGLTPSLGIEFDTWYNSNVNDPSYDHMSIFKNGVMDHASSSCLTSTVAASATSINIEDGAEHLVRVQWNSGSKTIKVWFDCYLRLTLQYDIQAQIFSNNSDVYWGFTSATGGAVNRHIVCLRDDILVPDSLQMCFGDTINLNSKVSSNNTYAWSPSSYLGSDSTKSPTCFPPTSQHFYVTYVNQCGTSVTDSTFVNVIDKIDLDFYINDSIQCFDNHTFIFYNTSNNITGNFKYLWDLADGLPSSSNDTIIKKYAIPGKYLITLKSNDQLGCNDSISKEIIIAPNPIANFEINDSIQCFKNHQFDFKNNSSDSSGIIKNLWDFGDGTQAQIMNASAKSYITPGDYLIHLIVETNFGCLDSFSKTIHIAHDPIAIFFINDSIQCLINNKFIFTDNSYITSGSLTNVWLSTNGTQLSNIDTIIETYTKSGNYLITLTVRSDYGCQDSLSKMIYINQEPTVSFSIDSVDKSCFELQFINSSKGDEIESFWTILNADSTSTMYTIDNPEHHLDKLVDSIFACLRVTDKYGCKDSVCLSFPNSYIESFDMYNVFTPNDDSFNDTYFFKIEGYSEFNLKIYNRWGELVFGTNNPNEGWNGTFENSGSIIPDGTYFYVVEYSMLCSLKSERKSGTVNLIRSN